MPSQAHKSQKEPVGNRKFNVASPHLCPPKKIVFPSSSYHLATTSVCTRTHPRRYGCYLRSCSNTSPLATRIDLVSTSHLPTTIGTPGSSSHRDLKWPGHRYLWTRCVTNHQHFSQLAKYAMMNWTELHDIEEHLTKGSSPNMSINLEFVHLSEVVVFQETKSSLKCFLNHPQEAASAGVGNGRCSWAVLKARDTSDLPSKRLFTSYGLRNKVLTMVVQFV